MLALLGLCMAPCLMSYAQTQAYADYPQTRGGVEQWKQEDFPSWLSLDGQIRLRTEQQTSYQYISGNDRIYELTRVYGGLTVRPTSYLTAYMQFIDTHALGLPVKHIASNMRDVFDLRQGYLEFHHNNIQLSPASSAATWPCQTSWIPCGLALSVPGGLLEKHSLGKTKIITS
jgi:hypothetical protein